MIMTRDDFLALFLGAIIGAVLFLGATS